MSADTIIDTTSILAPVMAQWTRRMGRHGAVPVVLVGMTPDGKLTVLSPPRELLPKENIIEALKVVISQLEAK